MLILRWLAIYFTPDSQRRNTKTALLVTSHHAYPGYTTGPPVRSIVPPLPG